MRQEKISSTNPEMIEVEVEGGTFQYHKSAFVDKDAVVGAGTKIWHFAHIMNKAIIGNNCVIGQGCVIHDNVRLGNGCKLQNYNSLPPETYLEDEVFIGPQVVFTNVLKPRAHIEQKNKYNGPYLKKRCTIGGGSCLMVGIIIGEYAMVGLGSVVVRDVMPYRVVMGNPARQLSWVDEKNE